MKTLFDGMERKILRSLVALLLLVLAAPAVAQNVALVTDLLGKAVVEGAPGGSRITILSEIAPDARVRLEGGARLVVVYLNSGDEYSFAGPAQIQFRSDAPQLASGTPPRKRASTLAEKAKEHTIRASGIAHAGFVMRSGRPTARIKLLTLSGTKTLEAAPEFRWQELEPETTYRFELTDETGKSLYHGDARSNSLRLPSSVRLRAGASYTWEVSAHTLDGRRYVSAGDFSIVTAETRAQAEALRPAPGAAVSDRVAYASWLEQMDLRDEARKYWRALSAERPGDPRLKALARE